MQRRTDGGHRGLLLGMLVCAWILVVAGPVLASKGGNGNGAGGSSQQSDPSLALNQSDPHLGGTVTFTSVYPKGTKNPRIQVECYQGGVLVYAEAGAYDFTFTLGGGSSQWVNNGGAAYCDAELYSLVWNGNNMQQVTWLAAIGFDAAG